MLACQFRQSSLKCEQHFVAMQSGINRRVGRVMVSRPMNLSHVEKLFERRKLAFQLGERKGEGISSAKTIEKSLQAFSVKKKLLLFPQLFN